MMQRVCAGTAGLVLVLLVSMPATVQSDEGESSLVMTTPHFAIHSDFETNLNDALIVAGVARGRDRPELFHDGAARECFAGLAPSARSGWNLAVDFYAEIVSPGGWMRRPQYLVRMELGGFDDELDDGSADYRRIAEGFRMAAAPAYESCRWQEQDAENRRWIGELIPKLAAHEAEITARLTTLYRTPWRGLPIRVDIVATALPVGANTYHTPPHIVIGTANDDSDALEIIHHEASHTLMRREDPVYRALSDAARAYDRELPRDLWHVVLFYTTGEAVRRTLAEAGQPDYTPYIYSHDLWNGSWGEYREAIEATWPAYLDGGSDLSSAASDLLRALMQPDSAN
jgi:hypothetical protein